jgi:hypothetical protein
MPSAVRRRSRHSLSSLAETPRKEAASTEKNRYKTPAPQQWEEGESLGSIDEMADGLNIAQDLEGVVEENSDGEIEYMPPPVQGASAIGQIDHIAYAHQHYLGRLPGRITI